MWVLLIRGWVAMDSIDFFENQNHFLVFLLRSLEADIFPLFLDQVHALAKTDLNSSDLLALAEIPCPCSMP